MAKHQEHVDYWNSNQNIGQYNLARARAEYEVVLFLEHLPYTLENWLVDNIKQLGTIVVEMRDTLTFLRKQGVIHFDVNIDNIIVTDGHQPYLTDFGLVLDSQFDLSDAERDFLAQHTHYDYGEFLYSLGAHHLFDLCRSLADPQRNELRRKYGLQEGMRYHDILTILLDNIEALYADEVIPINRYYVDTIVKYRPIIMLMHTFSTNMRSTNTKDTEFNHTELKRLLKETNFLTGETI